MEIENIPKHIVVIPDGNRRWAKEKGFPNLLGHKKGVEQSELLIKTARELGVKFYSSWAFSTENWKRSKEEVDYLFNLVREFVGRFKDQFIREKTRFIHLGRKDRLPEDILTLLTDFEETTKDFIDYTVCIGMDYGGHDEIVRAVKNVIAKGLEINEENIESNLDTKDIPAPDLIIRTGGEQRLSGYMAWQSAYSEYYFTKTYFPDFGKNELIEAIKNYGNRERRFGGDSKLSFN